MALNNLVRHLRSRSTPCDICVIFMSPHCSLDSTHQDHTLTHSNSSKPLANFPLESKNKFLKIQGEPNNEKKASRKQLKFDEESSSNVQTRLKDILGRVPWNYHSGSFAPYANGVGGLSQEKLQAIMNQLTTNIRVNGRRVSPLQAQIVHQSSNGDLNPSMPELNDMQNDMMSQLQDSMQPNMQPNMQDDMQSSKPNGMQNDDTGESEIKPIQIPWNSKGGNNAQSTSPSTFERLMFGGLSQIAGGGEGQNKGYSDFGGGVSNVPGLSFGGTHTSGVINLMESENGLKPMTGMNGMRSMNGMMTGMHGMTTNGMGGRMWGGRSFFSRRGETVANKTNELSISKNADNITRANKTHEHGSASEIHQVQKSHHETKPSVIRLIPSDRLTREKE